MSRGSARGADSDAGTDLLERTEPHPTTATGAHDRLPSHTQRTRRPGATAQLDLRGWRTPKPAADLDGARAQERDAATVELHVGADVKMRTPGGPELAPWMRGEVTRNALLVSYPLLPKDNDREIVAARFSARLVRELEAAGFTLPLLAEALRRDVWPDTISRLLQQSAPPSALAFVIDAAGSLPIGEAVERALHIFERWGEQAPQVYQSLHTLLSDPHLRNREDLQLWYHGLSAPGAAGEGYATMLLDAVDLVQAGHDLYVERCPSGNGDLIDETERVTYQHKRVTGRRIKHALQKAAKQLAGFVTSDEKSVQGAPPGHRGIVQLDMRGNANFSGASDQELAALVAEPPLRQSEALYEIQLVLDDRMLVFDRDQRLVKVVHEGERR